MLTTDSLYVPRGDDLGPETSTDPSRWTGPASFRFFPKSGSWALISDDPPG
jgi:hypothetical protein